MPNNNVYGHRLSIQIHTDRMRAGAYNNKDKNEIILGEDTTVAVREVNRKKEKCEKIKELKGHKKRVNVVAYDPYNPNVIASCSDDHTIKIWDKKKGAVLYTLQGHWGPVESVAFNPYDSYEIISGSADKTVRVWRLCRSFIDNWFFLMVVPLPKPLLWELGTIE